MRKQRPKIRKRKTIADSLGCLKNTKNQKKCTEMLSKSAEMKICRKNIICILVLPNRAESLITCLSKFPFLNKAFFLVCGYRVIFQEKKLDNSGKRCIKVKNTSKTTADFMKKVPSVYTNSMKTIYLSLSAQVAEWTIFRKSPVLKDTQKYVDGKSIIKTFTHIWRYVSIFK